MRVYYDLDRGVPPEMADHFEKWCDEQREKREKEILSLKDYNTARLTLMEMDRLKDEIKDLKKELKRYKPNTKMIKVEGDNKKDPKKLIPFDFSLKEDRVFLMNKVLFCSLTHTFFKVKTFIKINNSYFANDIDSTEMYSEEFLFQNFIFAGTETPVGKEI